jgi:hypothetical protein
MPPARFGCASDQGGFLFQGMEYSSAQRFVGEEKIKKNKKTQEAP